MAEVILVAEHFVYAAEFNDLLEEAEDVGKYILDAEGAFMDKKKAVKKAALLFVAEFVVWILAGLLIGGVIKKDWTALLANTNFYILAAVFSLLSAYFDYQKSTGGKK